MLGHGVFPKALNMCTHTHMFMATKTITITEESYHLLAALKGVIIKKTGELAALAGFAGLEPAYAGVRYPDAPAVRPTPAEAQHNISLARTVVEWSQSQLK